MGDGVKEGSRLYAAAVLIAIQEFVGDAPQFDDVTLVVAQKPEREVDFN
ncbi:MAG: hypothetical protein H6667_18300 [Ardenticatenaceae bacterium]|nr:hypothetical protein [Ardenticatenaceae bacterium]